MNRLNAATPLVFAAQTIKFASSKPSGDEARNRLEEKLKAAKAPFRAVSHFGPVGTGLGGNTVFESVDIQVDSMADARKVIETLKGLTGLTNLQAPTPEQLGIMRTIETELQKIGLTPILGLEGEFLTVDSKSGPRANGKIGEILESLGAREYQVPGSWYKTYTFQNQSLLVGHNSPQARYEYLGYSGAVSIF